MGEPVGKFAGPECALLQQVQNGAPSGIREGAVHGAAAGRWCFGNHLVTDNARSSGVRQQRSLKADKTRRNGRQVRLLAAMSR
jgi:hypothetical protein